MRKTIMRVCVPMVVLIFSMPCAYADVGVSAHADVAKGPQAEITPAEMYAYLVAEVAAQRGDWAVASPAYLKVAQQTADASVARQAVQAGIQAGEADVTNQASQLWLSEQPTSQQALHTRIVLLLQSSNPIEAEPYLLSLMKQHPEEVGGEFLQVGDILGHQSNKTQSSQLIQALAEKYPQVAEAHLALAQDEARNAKFDLAIKQIDIANTLKPGWDLAAKLRFELLNQTVSSAAEPFVLGYLKLHPNATETRLAYARFLLAENRFQAARDQFALLVEKFPGNADIQAAFGMVDMQLNNLASAKTAFLQALHLGYANPDLLAFYLGQIAEVEKHDDEALTWYRLVDAGQEYVPAQMREAVVLVRQGKVKQAQDVLHATVTTSDSDRILLIRAEAQLLHESGDTNAAYQVLGGALATHPDSVPLLYDHAMMAESSGHLEVAVANLQHLLQLQPNYAEGLNALGYIFADHNEHLDEAESLLRHALQLSPDDAFILDSMGWVQYRLGHLAEAETYLERAYAGSHDPEVAAHLGEVLWKAGKYDAARQLWQSAQTIHPNNLILRAAAEKFN